MAVLQLLGLQHYVRGDVIDLHKDSGMVLRSARGENWRLSLVFREFDVCRNFPSRDDYFHSNRGQGCLRSLCCKFGDFMRIRKNIVF